MNSGKLAKRSSSVLALKLLMPDNRYQPIKMATPTKAAWKANGSRASGETVIVVPGLRSASGIRPRILSRLSSLGDLITLVYRRRAARLIIAMPKTTALMTPTVADINPRSDPAGKPSWVKASLIPAAVPCPPENPISRRQPKKAGTPNSGARTSTEIPTPTMYCPIPTIHP